MLHEVNGTPTSGTKYFALSQLPTPKVRLATVRSHWTIGNALHWQLGVFLREDVVRSRKGNGTTNFAVLRLRVAGFFVRH